MWVNFMISQNLTFLRSNELIIRILSERYAHSIGSFDEGRLVSVIEILLVVDMGKGLIFKLLMMWDTLWGTEKTRHFLILVQELRHMVLI